MTESTPLISIVMNCYNSDQFLKEAIDSIYAQTYTNWEIIFWDNASTDNSAAIAKSYDERVKYYFVSETTPLGEARNLALINATGKYVAFLDCDDLYEPEKLQKQVLLMEMGDFVYCYGGAIVVNEQNHEINRVIINNNSGNIFGKLLKRYDVNMQTVMIHRSVLNNNHINFDTSLTFSPDYDLFMELASIGRVGVLEGCIVRYRKTNDSLTLNSADKIYKEIKHTLDRLSDNIELAEHYDAEFKYAYKMLNYSKTICYISNENYQEARASFKKIIDVKIKYRFFYYLLFLPISKKFLLKKLLGY